MYIDKQLGPLDETVLRSNPPKIFLKRGNTHTLFQFDNNKEQRTNMSAKMMPDWWPRFQSDGPLVMCVHDTSPLCLMFIPVLRDGVRCQGLRDGGCHDIVSRVTHRCHTNTSHFPAVSHSILNNEPRHANQQARITFNWSNWGNGRGRGGLINQKKFINTYSARRKVCEVWSLVTKLSRKKGEDLAGLSDLGLVTFWIVDCKVYRSNFENKSSWRFSLK